jgi:hypothetical protein
MKGGQMAKKSEKYTPALRGALLAMASLLPFLIALIVAILHADGDRRVAAELLHANAAAVAYESTKNATPLAGTFAISEIFLTDANLWEGDIPDCVPYPLKDKPCVDAFDYTNAIRSVDEYAKSVNPIFLAPFRYFSSYPPIQVGFIRMKSAQIETYSSNPLLRNKAAIYYMLFPDSSRSIEPTFVIDIGTDFYIAVASNSDVLRDRYAFCVEGLCPRLDGVDDILTNMNIERWISPEITIPPFYVLLSKAAISNLIQVEYGISNSDDDQGKLMNAILLAIRSDRPIFSYGPFSLSARQSIVVFGIIYLMNMSILTFSLNNYGVTRRAPNEAWIVADHRGLLQFLYALTIVLSPLLCLLAIALVALHTNASMLYLFGYAVYVDPLGGAFQFARSTAAPWDTSAIQSINEQFNTNFSNVDTLSSAALVLFCSSLYLVWRSTRLLWPTFVRGK